MKCFIVVNSLSLGGAERVGVNLAKWLNKQKEVQVYLIALKAPQGNSYDVEGINCYHIEGQPVIRKLRSCAKNLNPDIVLTMGVPLSVYTVPALWGLKVRHVISERNDPHHFSGKWITKIISRLLMRNADGYVFQTKQAQQSYCRNIVKKSVVIHNPLTNIPVFPDIYKIEKKNVIISVGRLVPQKNQKMLIEAFAEMAHKIPDYILEIWGEGAERNNLQLLIDKRGMRSRVFLCGNSNKVFEKLAYSRLFVLCSDFEGMPNALMEAMALGLPCISTDCPCGGPAELIESGVNGVLVPVNNVNEMASAIKKIILDEEYAESLGKNASLIRETHSRDMICRQWKAFFNQVLN